MSLLSDTVFSGSARLHLTRGDTDGKDGAKGTSYNPGGFLTPLIQLVKYPLGKANATREEERAPTFEEGADRRQLLYLRMKDAGTYEDWKAAATELDALEGNQIWKSEDVSAEYDVELVKARLEQLDEARTNCDVKRMLFLVRTTLSRGLGGMGDLRLYKHSHMGTKALIERYIDSAVQTLAALPDVVAKQADQCPITSWTAKEELARTRQSFGRTALLLSGGGTFGMSHIGVVKCLWQLRLLPRIISGTSAGSIVCAVLCSKTDAEIPEVLHEFCYGDMAVFEKEGESESVMAKVTRFLKYGSLFDISHLTRVMRNMLGDITFRESYNRTQRVLNITVSSASMYELPRILNYITAPDVMIWSAVCASCSVPFIFSAASLIAKDHLTGKEAPWNPTPNEGWIDGSVDNDLPMNRLAEMFNVNHFIVSQVNPHVVPFLAKEEEAIGTEVQESPAYFAGSGWMHNMANLAKGEALHRLDVLTEMGVFPNAMTKARSILSQRYSGDITIFPTISYTNFPKILSNPTTEYMLRCLLTGEQATWPKVSRIRNHVAVELAIHDAFNQMNRVAHFDEMQATRGDLARYTSQDAEPLGMRRLQNPARVGSYTTQPTPSTELTFPVFARRVTSQSTLLAQATSRSSLPIHRSRNGTRSLDISKPLTHDAISSTDAEGSSADGDFSSNDESESTEILSSPSPPYYPSSRLPDLTPLTLPASVWNPSAPSIPSIAPGRRSGSSFDHVPAPSSPELRYKRLFHPPTLSSQSGPPYVQPGSHQEAKMSLQPLTQLTPLSQNQSVAATPDDSSQGHEPD